MNGNDSHQESVRLDLCQAASHLLEECRMVLPGIQTIFGFQLIAVFSERFGMLTAAQQQLHIVALVLVAFAAALVMTPAAYHRTREKHRITEVFVQMSSRLLLGAMFPLAVALALDVYVIGTVIFRGAEAARLLASGVFAVMFFLWFVLPRIPRLHRALGAS